MALRIGAVGPDQEMMCAHVLGLDKAFWVEFGPMPRPVMDWFG